MSDAHPTFDPESVQNPNEPFTAAIQCPWCQRHSLVTVTPDQVARIRAGEDANKVFPEYGPDQWELFITGICVQCWEKTKGPDD